MLKHSRAAFSSCHDGVLQREEKLSWTPTTAHTEGSSIRAVTKRRCQVYQLTGFLLKAGLGVPDPGVKK